MLLISDANIFIDMEEAELTDTLFQLPDEFAVPDILYEEELSEQHSDLLDKGLHIKSMSGNIVMEAYNLRQKYNKPGQNDLNALAALAKSEGCPLLTGNGDLRKAAKAEKINVMGTLWIIQRMFEERLLTKQQAAEAYEKMREGRRRLPWQIVEKQLNEFN